MGASDRIRSRGTRYLSLRPAVGVKPEMEASTDTLFGCLPFAIALCDARLPFRSILSVCVPLAICNCRAIFRPSGIRSHWTFHISLYKPRLDTSIRLAPDYSFPMASIIVIVPGTLAKLTGRAGRRSALVHPALPRASLLLIRRPPYPGAQGGLRSFP